MPDPDADLADLPASARRVVEAATALGLSVELASFPDGTRTAEDAARAVGCDVAQIVKSLVFLCGGRAVLALVGGANRLDEAKLAALADVGVDEVRRATADEVRAARSATTAPVAASSGPGATAKTWLGVPAAAHTSSCASRSSSAQVGSGAG